MIESDRFISATPMDHDLSPRREERQDHAIRPDKLADYEGQPAVREQMEIFIGAARAREEALDHTLVFGPPGLGKKTLANIIALDMGSNIKTTSGPVIAKAGDLPAMLTNLEPADGLYIYEIQHMSPAIQDKLSPYGEG